MSTIQQQGGGAVQQANPVQVQATRTKAGKAIEAMKANKLATALALGMLGLYGYKGYEAIKPQAQAAVSASERALSPAEALGRVGQKVTVEFTAADAKAFRGRNPKYIINDKVFPNQTFSVVVMGSGDLNATGRKVRASGVVTPYTSRYDGKVTMQLVVSPDQVKIGQ